MLFLAPARRALVALALLLGVLPHAHAQTAAARDTLALDLTDLLDGATFDSALDADAPRDAEGLAFHLYRLTGTPGDLYHVELDGSEALVLEFGVFEDDLFLPIATAEPSDSLLLLDVIARAAGEVYFRVTTDAEEAQDYSLFFAGEHGPAEDAAYAPCPTLALGAARNGTLDLDATGAALNPALCALDVPAGTAFTLALRSADFDALVAVGRLVNGYFVPLDVNDDDEAAADTDAPTDARLSFTAPPRARLYALVSGFGEAGTYRLDVARADRP